MTERTGPAGNEQSARALQLANQIRRTRAALKTRVATGEVAASDIILACPQAVTRMPLDQLLGAQRGWGHARCRACLARLSLPENKPIGSLTDRQRRTVASLLNMTDRTPTSATSTVVRTG